MKITPAQLVIEKLGAHTIAAHVGISVNAVHKWKSLHPWIPGQHIESIYQLAQFKGVNITYKDLVVGRGKC